MKNIQSFPLIVPNNEGWEPFSVKSLLKLHRIITVCFKGISEVTRLFYNHKKKETFLCLRRL